MQTPSIPTPPYEQATQSDLTAFATSSPLHCSHVVCPSFGWTELPTQSTHPNPTWRVPRPQGMHTVPSPEEYRPAVQETQLPVDLSTTCPCWHLTQSLLSAVAGYPFGHSRHDVARSPEYVVEPGHGSQVDRPGDNAYVPGAQGMQLSIPSG